MPDAALKYSNVNGPLRITASPQSPSIESIQARAEYRLLRSLLFFITCEMSKTIKRTTPRSSFVFSFLVAFFINAYRLLFRHRDVIYRVPCGPVM